jgi:hypothetical protein
MGKGCQVLDDKDNADDDDEGKNDHPNETHD